MTKATIDDIDISGKRVLLRVDFNVPLRHGRVGDDRRISEALPTVNALRERGARTIIVTHIGRPGGRVDASLSVQPIADRLGELLGVDVPVARDVVGPSAQALVDALADGDVAMLENVRFEAGEERNDPALAQRLASFADVVVNDAFGTAHRAHASTEGVAHLLPAVAGYLMARELEVLGGVLGDPRRPLVAVLGGAKISTKLGVLTNLLNRVDSLHVGGAMACTFFRAKGAATGRSLVEEDKVQMARDILDVPGATAQLRLPFDVVVAAEATDGAGTEVVSWDAIPDDLMVVDVGPQTVAAIAADFRDAGTVIWNGPLGIYEVDAFARGTRAVAKALGESDAFSVVGGGDLGAAVDDSGVADSIDFISTGGGATLEFLEGCTLPGVAALRDRETVAK
ncbi:MAG: phosphoglycerate kinase [Candidatus Dormibacteraeota bacterium]|uniref:Phosphoglycerate kinase n=1 Tax=Candidatus Aeolococcus gillhamiae TaxID=3127015 RepID=A0A2W6AIG2_9BACT|nr:phosphoglycerate kinase [Candidatus Dormibacteraeota bacterium]PZR83374.1 MAG: phosphoglycerate kinase [Candidatus Dormibacter sp. RRmetagenome_bin12]